MVPASTKTAIFPLFSMTSVFTLPPPWTSRTSAVPFAIASSKEISLPTSTCERDVTGKTTRLPKGLPLPIA